MKRNNIDIIIHYYYISKIKEKKTKIYENNILLKVKKFTTKKFRVNVNIYM